MVGRGSQCLADQKKKEEKEEEKEEVEEEEEEEGEKEDEEEEKSLETRYTTQSHSPNDLLPPDMHKT